MAFTQFTKKELIAVIEDQQREIREQTERIEQLKHFNEALSENLCDKESMRLTLEMTPNDCPIDEFMIAGAIYRYCLKPGTNLDPEIVADMIFNKLASERKRKFSEEDEDE